jgi:hypothetical protein
MYASSIFRGSRVGGGFLAAASQGDKAFDYDLYRLKLATNSVGKLTSANGYATDLCVSPDGTHEIFLRWTSGWGSLPNISKLYVLTWTRNP